MTTGQGLARRGKSYGTTPKKIFVKPLAEHFRGALCSYQGGAAMGKASRRPNREEIKAKRRQRKRAQRELGRKLEEEGLKRSSHGTIANRKSGYKSVEEEGLARNDATWAHARAGLSRRGFWWRSTTAANMSTASPVIGTP